MAFEEPVDRCFAHAHCLVRCWDQTPQVEEPAGGDIVGKFEKLRIITPQKFPDAIAKPIALGAQVVGDTRPFAQLHDGRIHWRQGPEAARIGPERIGENLGVAAVVLGAGGREAITKAIELLWIDGVNPETRSIKLSTTGPCGTSIATKTASGVAPVNFKIQATSKTRTPHGASTAAARRGTGPPRCSRHRGCLVAPDRSAQFQRLPRSKGRSAARSTLLRYAPRRAPSRAQPAKNR